MKDLYSYNLLTSLNVAVGPPAKFPREFHEGRKIYIHTRAQNCFFLRFEVSRTLYGRPGHYTFSQT